MADQTTTDEFVSDPIDEKLKDIYSLCHDYVFSDITFTLGQIDSQKRQIENSKHRLRDLRKTFAEKKKLVMEARAALREIDDVTISGKSVAADLGILDNLYRRHKDSAATSAVYLWKFGQCKKQFIDAHSNDRAAYKRYTIWVIDNDTVHRVDLTWTYGVWRDAFGSELRKWGGMVIADHGIAITGNSIVTITPGICAFARHHVWVSYPIPGLDDAPAEHSDKKQRAGGD